MNDGYKRAMSFVLVNGTRIEVVLDIGIRFGLSVIVSRKDEDAILDSLEGDTTDPAGAVSLLADGVSQMVHKWGGIHGAEGGEEEKFARQVELAFQHMLEEDGVIERKGDEWVDVDYDHVFGDLFKEEVPKTMAGLPHKGNKFHYSEQREMNYWVVTWGEGEDKLDIELSIPSMDGVGARVVADRLRGQLQEKVALLRIKHPGEFEVECVDATGQEDRFDEGVTYMAENGDRDMIWVYDRFGEKGEFSRSRFRRTAVPKFMDLTKTGEDKINIRFIGEPMEYFQHYQSGDLQ